MKVLVTGASGMIGNCLVKELLCEKYIVIGVDRFKNDILNEYYHHYCIDLADKNKLLEIIKKEKINRIIHLAALAHSRDGKEFAWEKYKFINIECAKNVFESAGDIPVLFISTVDVYGFAREPVDIYTKTNPVSNYAKSKLLAEIECKKVKYFDIFRFAPVYTDLIKRDIQKRYYLKYPSIAYLLGKGMEYEVLSVKIAITEMVEWCKRKPTNTIKLVKNEKRMNTRDCIKEEKEAGRAKLVIYIPLWLAKIALFLLMIIIGENKYTYLLNKALYPLRSVEI